MLKRYQVLINDWLAEHIKKISDRYDLSFSETIRSALCLAYLDLIKRDYPGYKTGMDRINREMTLKEGNYEKEERVEFHRRLSKIYFETHKAIDYFWEEEKKKKKAG